jgi:hypothetical protein
MAPSIGIVEYNFRTSSVTGELRVPDAEKFTEEVGV